MFLRNHTITAGPAVMSTLLIPYQTSLQAPQELRESWRRRSLSVSLEQAVETVVDPSVSPIPGSVAIERIDVIGRVRQVRSIFLQWLQRSVDWVHLRPVLYNPAMLLETA